MRVRAAGECVSASVMYTLKSRHAVLSKCAAKKHAGIFSHLSPHVVNHFVALTASMIICSLSLSSHANPANKIS